MFLCTPFATTIIVKSVGKVAFFTSSFPSFPRPWPNIDQNVNVWIFSKRENSLFSGLKWTTFKLCNLPNYFCL